MFGLLASTVSVSSILTDVGSFLTFLFGQFAALFDAITSNPWLLFTILLGFSGSAVALVIRIVKRVRRI